MTMDRNRQAVRPGTDYRHAKARLRSEFGHRATMNPIRVETLEDRFLLSHGSADIEHLEFADTPSQQANSLAKSQIVQLNVTDLVADGILSAAQAAAAQDGKWQAVRIDQYLLINDQYYQFAGGPGYPLVPVSGPTLPSDIGAARDPVPVLLPLQQPASPSIQVASSVASTPTPARTIPSAPGTTADFVGGSSGTVDVPQFAPPPAVPSPSPTASAAPAASMPLSVSTPVVDVPATVVTIVPVTTPIGAPSAYPGGSVPSGSVANVAPASDVVTPVVIAPSQETQSAVIPAVVPDTNLAIVAPVVITATDNVPSSIAAPTALVAILAPEAIATEVTTGDPAVSSGTDGYHRHCAGDHRGHGHCDEHYLRRCLNCFFSGSDRPDSSHRTGDRHSDARSHRTEPGNAIGRHPGRYPSDGPHCCCAFGSHGIRGYCD